VGAALDTTPAAANKADTRSREIAAKFIEKYDTIKQLKGYAR
jgi:hypothetical protein